MGLVYFTSFSGSLKMVVTRVSKI